MKTRRVLGLCLVLGIAFGQATAQNAALKAHLIKGEWSKVFSTTSELPGARSIVFKDYLYAGYACLNADPAAGAQIWRSRDGDTWEPASEPAFGNALEPLGLFHCTYLDNLFVFQGQLYAGLGWWYSDNATFWEPKGGQIWRTANGTEWEKVLDLAADAHNEELGSFMEFNGFLYASTLNWFEGFQIWRSPTGNPGDWAKVADEALGTHLLSPGLNKMVVHHDTLFFVPGTLVDQDNGYSQTPVHVWYTRDGLNWTLLTADGFGDTRALAASSVARFRGDVYLELWMYDGANAWTQVRRINQDLGSDVYCDVCTGLGNWVDGYFYKAWWDQGLVVIRSQDLLVWEPVTVPEVNDPAIIGASWLNKFKGEFYFLFTMAEPEGNWQIWK
jgi:hypothetical protein